jgi:pimeloyl-ACP methyl ester carboxylesterase
MQHESEIVAPHRDSVDSMDAREGRSIEVNGAALYVEQHGSGTPVVLIHGGLLTNAMWDPLLPALRDGLRVITPDSRGHGRSTDPAGVMSFPQIADDVAALIGELGLERPVVGGYSDGGQVALELGARHPDVAGALIVGGAYPDWVGTGLREVWRELLGADAANTPDLAHLDASLGEGADELKSLHPGGEAQWRTLVDRTAPMWLDYEGPTDDDLRRIQVPTLVFSGDRDAQITVDLSVSLYRALPNAELAICPGADHAGPIRERADAFAAAIRDFATRQAVG